MRLSLLVLLLSSVSAFAVDRDPKPLTERRLDRIERLLGLPSIDTATPTATPVVQAAAYEPVPQATFAPTFAPQQCVGGQCGQPQSSSSQPFRLFRRLR